MKIGVFAVLVILLASFAFALEATQDSMAVSVIPEFSQPGKISLTISGANPGSYNIYTLTAVKILPSTPFYLGAGKNAILLDIYPTSDLIAQGPAAYSFTYNLRNTETEENFEDTMTVRVVRIEDAFSLGSDSNNPDSDKITFYLKNKEDIELNRVHAKFSSIFFDFEETFDIKANEKKEFSISVDKEKLGKIEAGSYLLEAEVQTNRGERTLEGRITLGEKKGIETKENTEGFFIRTTEVTKINYGNVVEQVSVNVKKNVFSRLFTSVGVDPDVVSRDGFGVVYSWSRELGPSESFEVKVKTNYLFPILIIVALVLIIIGFKRYAQTKLEIVKSVIPVKTKADQFALKIKLHVTAKKKISNVSLIDRIPGVVQIYEKFDSIIKPSKIDVKNRRIQWDLGGMEAGEERIFSYMVYSSVGVVGKFSLPQALAVFEKEGTIHEVESNTVYFLAEQVSRD